MRNIGGIRIPEKDTYKIQSTFRYDDFKFIEGNRNIDHEDRIEKSIRKSGLLLQPILVNQRMEIVEGQNRYIACRNMGLPIYFVIQDDIGLDEVKNLNSASKNWTTRNYIHSFAAGDKKLDYIYIEQLMKAYPWATQSIISFATHGVTSGGGTVSRLKDGDFKCDEAEYNRAVKAFDYAAQFVDNINGVGGRKEYYMIAIIFCYFCEEVDNEYLYAKFKKYHKSLSPITNIKEAILQIEGKVYNYQLRAPREPISISMEYERLRRANRSRKNRED